MAAVALITGASGLIGQQLIRQWDIDGLTAVPVNQNTDDLLKPGVASELVRRVRPAVIVHLAWAASGTPGYRTSTENALWVDSSVELSLASREVDAWFLGTGTSVDNEASPDAYAAAKGQLWERLKFDVIAEQITWLRPYYVIDPDRRRPALVDAALGAREVGREVALRTPRALHDFVHAADVGRGVLIAIRHGLRGELPLGSGKLRAVSDVVEALNVRWSGSQRGHLPATQHHGAADMHRLRSCGWLPRMTEEFFARD